MENLKDLCDICELKSPDENKILEFLEERFKRNAFYVSSHSFAMNNYVFKKRNIFSKNFFFNLRCLVGR